MKEHIPGKQISLKVKFSTEKLLQDITEIVAKDLNARCPTKTINEEDLLKCKRPFESVVHMSEEHEYIVKSLEGLQMKMDTVVQDFRKKFDLKEQEAGQYFRGNDTIMDSE